jgi:hypothetical protein
MLHNTPRGPDSLLEAFRYRTRSEHLQIKQIKLETLQLGKLAHKVLLLVVKATRTKLLTAHSQLVPASRSQPACRHVG